MHTKPLNTVVTGKEDLTKIEENTTGLDDANTCSSKCETASIPLAITTSSVNSKNNHKPLRHHSYHGGSSPNTEKELGKKKVVNISKSASNSGVDFERKGIQNRRATPKLNIAPGLIDSGTANPSSSCGNDQGFLFGASAAKELKAANGRGDGENKDGSRSSSCSGDNIGFLTLVRGSAPGSGGYEPIIPIIRREEERTRSSKDGDDTTSRKSYNSSGKDDDADGVSIISTINSEFGWDNGDHPIITEESPGGEEENYMESGKYDDYSTSGWTNEICPEQGISSSMLFGGGWQAEDDDNDEHTLSGIHDDIHNDEDDEVSNYARATGLKGGILREPIPMIPKSRSGSGGCDLSPSTGKMCRNSSSTYSLSLAIPPPTEPINKQSLKHLSASAPAIRGDLIGVKAEFMAPSSSKSRQKKFHRHFKTVPPEEKVLDYYSCALVGDILLQGFLYISENYFAFYSNVFGYVTKLLIPVCSVESITKERTAKIFPNAVAVRTQSEKHVFASLISRDNTYKLMNKVWMHINNQQAAKLSDKGEDLPDESSAESGSGNDSALEPSSCSPSPQSTPGIEKLLHAKLLPSTTMTMIKNNNNLISHGLHAADGGMTGHLDEIDLGLNGMRSRTLETGRSILTSGQLSSTQAYLRNPLRTSVGINNNLNLKSKNEGSLVISGSSKNLLILATALLVLLFFSAAFLLLRISNLQQKLTEGPGVVSSEKFYQDLMTWQHRLHSNSAEEIHQFIDTNLQQIVRVRESLEALSTLFLNGQPGGRDHDHHHISSASSQIGNSDG